MTFTFSNTLSTDLAKVRFHTGDTSEDGAYLADETITALLTSEGSVGGAVVACLKYIITQLSVPTFRKDWLSVDSQSARQGFENLLKVKAQEFGIAAFGVTTTATIANPYRADSYQYTSATSRETTESEEVGIYDGTP
jgi:hypothetical protein